MLLDRISFSIRQLLINKKNIIFFWVLVLLLIAAFSLYFLILKSSALNTQGISDYSTIKTTEATNYFILQKDKGYIYKSQKEGIDAVNEFIRLNPSYNKVKLLPEDFDKNSILGRSVKDSEDPFLKKRNINLTNEHYFIDQKINGIPIYGAQLAVHLKNKNEIYSVSGNLVKTKETTKQKTTEEKAKEIALSEALKDSAEKKLKITEAKKYIFNKKIIGFSDDITNYLTLGVIVDSDSELFSFSTKYFIKLDTGELIFKENLMPDILNREIYDCRSGSCILTRTEGAPPYGEFYIDGLYDVLGNVYNYFFNNFGRDSIDGNGGPLKGRVRPPCRNAGWKGGYMNICTDVYGVDVIAHEMTHGITEATAGLTYNLQSGALNESISDVFGSALDNNWTMGESTSLGIMRDMSNPPAKGDPDRLFSNYYWCSGDDNGGVHTNSGVLNKAFYLMTDGGSLNGCSINGIGRERSHAVIYQALTRYLSPTSNFKSMYNSVLQACNDLYPSSSECENVKAALQATEMDQQPDATQIGVKCQGVQPSQPVCAGGVAPTNPPVTPSSNLTSTPGPGQPTSTPEPTTTGVPGQPTSTPTTQPPGGGGPTLTPTPTPVQTYTCREASTGSKAKPGSIKIGSLICEPN